MSRAIEALETQLYEARREWDDRIRDAKNGELDLTRM